MLIFSFEQIEIEEKDIGFDLFFQAISHIKDDLKCEQINRLIDICDKFFEQSHNKSYMYFKDYLLDIYCDKKLKLASLHNEDNYRNKIIEYFDEIFPDYTFIKKEYGIKKTKLRVDIFAKDNISQTPVIIEIKKDNTNPKDQLNKYSKYFENPVLIAINKMPIENNNDIDSNIEYLSVNFNHGCKRT